MLSPLDLESFRPMKKGQSRMRNIVNFLKREDGPTAVEYAVMLALIIVVCLVAITALGTNAARTDGGVQSDSSIISRHSPPGCRSDSLVILCARPLDVVGNSVNRR